MWCVVKVFTKVFKKLEAEELLDPLNDVDLFCLHYIFMPKINKAISKFQTSWNRHSLSTEGNMSPYELFHEGANNYVANHFDIDVTLAPF